MRNWMFIQQFTQIREYLLENFDLRLLGDLGTGAFEEVSAAQVVLSVVMSIFWKSAPSKPVSIAYKPTPPEDTASTGHTERKRAALIAQTTPCKLN